MSKLSDAEGEAAETQVWLEFTVRCNYAPRDQVRPIYDVYEEVIKMIVAMINSPEQWIISPLSKFASEEPEIYGDPF